MPNQDSILTLKKVILDFKNKILAKKMHLKYNFPLKLTQSFLISAIWMLEIGCL